MPVTLDTSVRLVTLQFSFSNGGVVPVTIRRLPEETIEERVARKSYPSNGVMAIFPTEKCSLAEFVEELKAMGYELGDASYKKRMDGKDYRGNKKYYMVRFVFARHEFAHLSDETKKLREIFYAELQRICEEAHWRVRAFLNPWYKNGEEVSGQHVISINMEGRRPLFEADDPTRPVTKWQRDEKGRKIGVAPLPLQPECELHVFQGTIDTFLSVGPLF